MTEVIQEDASQLAGAVSPDISIIIVNWNSRAYLSQCLTSIFKHTNDVTFEVLIIDNGSFDGCQQMLARDFPTCVFIQSPGNLGFARANNLAASRASGRHLLFLNPDTELTGNSIRVLRDSLVALPHAGAAGCRLLNPDRTLQTSCVQSFPTVINQFLDSDYLHRLQPGSKLWGNSVLYSQHAGATAVGAISGACLFVDADAFHQIGGFTESYFMYGEDLDLCYKLHRMGKQVIHVPTTTVIHYGGGSTASGDSTSSNVRMREAVYRFFLINKGTTAAYTYRVTIAAAALLRLALLSCQHVFRILLRRSHNDDSRLKWAAILRWSLGLGHPQNPATSEVLDAAVAGH